MMQENLVKLWEQSFRDNRELSALTDYFKKETFSYLDVAKEVAKLHLLLKEAGIRTGDKIALIGRNNPRWVMAYVATITYGAVIVPILQDFTPNDINHIINHSESKLLFVGDTFWDVIEQEHQPSLKGAFSLTDYACVWEKDGDKLSKFQKKAHKHFKDKYRRFGANDIKYADVPNDALCLLNYTSGTTGFSKGVMLTINNLTGNVVFGIEQNIHYRGSRTLAFLPLAHAYGCAFDMLLPLACGTHLTLLGKIPSPKILLEAMAEVKPTLICTVPMIIEKVIRKQVFPIVNKRWMKAALNVPIVDELIYSSIRAKLKSAFGGEFSQVIIGGAPINGEVEEFLQIIKFPFTVGYGMTECAPLISYAWWENYKLASCGAIIPRMEFKILSEDPYSIPGEVCVRGEHVMKGYYKNEQATADVLDKEGWLHTGDMGICDTEGNIYLRGRSKTMILSASGQNIYPEEIESKLNNLRCVLESLVMERDGKLVALVVPDYEQSDAEGISRSDLQAVMDENLGELNGVVASYEKVSSITLYPYEFEKTPKKSIKRYLYTTRQ